MKNLILPDYFQFIIIAILVLLLFIRNKKTHSPAFLDFEVTDSIRGFSILLIIIHHIDRFRLVDNNQLNLFYNAGSIGVGLFLILSGYGLMESFQQKGLPNNYFIHKFIRIFIPFILINNLILFYDVFFQNKVYSLSDSILYASGILNNADQNFWYIKFLLFYYITFYLTVSFIKTKREIVFVFVGIALFVLFNEYFGYTARINAFSFTLGILISTFKNELQDLIFRIKSFTILFYLSILTLAFTALVLICIVYKGAPFLMRLNYAVAGIIILPIILFSKKINKFEKLSCSAFTLIVLSIFFSTGSLEFYSWAFLHIFIGLILLHLAKIYYEKSIPFFYNKIGQWSYELYLIHGFFMYKYDIVLSACAPQYSIPIYFAFIIFLSWLLNILFNKLSILLKPIISIT